MKPPLVVTLDLEDHRGGADGAQRYVDNAAAILDALTARGIRATVFVVGELVTSIAALIRRGADAGHEFGLHSVTHTPLAHEDPAHYAPALAAAKANLEDVTGSTVAGYRAPVFSLVAATPWVAGLLTELGFRYSSSVLPAANPLFGYPGAPTVTFRWPSGLVELPAPLAAIGPVRLPFAGGIYLRYLPAALQRRWLERLDEQTPRWAYLHPYDIDSSEGYYRFPGTTVVQSLLLWRNRRATLRKLWHLVACHDDHTARFIDVVDALDTTRLPRFDPGAQHADTAVSSA